MVHFGVHLSPVPSAWATPETALPRLLQPTITRSLSEAGGQRPGPTGGSTQATAGRPEGALLGSQPAAPLRAPNGEPRAARWGHLGVRGRAQRHPPPGPGEPRPPPASPRTRPPQSSALHPLLSRGRASFRPLPPRFVGQPLALPRRGDPAPRPQTAGPPAGATMKTQSPINYDDARR